MHNGHQRDNRMDCFGNLHSAGDHFFPEAVWGDLGAEGRYFLRCHNYYSVFYSKQLFIQQGML